MPIINQLFTKKPLKELLIIVIKAFGIENLRDKHEFTIKKLEEINTVGKINNIKDILKEYYVPCKHKIFLMNLTTKKCITIARQFLKLYNYDIASIEKSVNNKKILYYHLISQVEKEINKNTTSTKKNGKKEYIITFD